MSDIAPHSPDKARIKPWLSEDERVLWLWTQPHTPHPAWQVACLVLLGLGVIALALTSEPTPRLRRAVFAAALLALMGIAAMLARRFGNGTVRAGAAQVLRDLTDPGPHPRAGLHVLTQYRFLTLRDGELSQTSLTPGEAIIQYGSFRIDRPDHRGGPLLRKIPMAQQHCLFAALQTARRLRDRQKD